MNPSPQEESRSQSATQIATAVVVNIIWWMAMIAAIIMGAIHLKNCPIQPKIPIYLIVLGASSIVSLSVTYGKSIWDDGCICILNASCAALLHVFSFCWLIAGTVWVYPVYPPDYISYGPQYCHRSTYLFAFIVTTVVWVTVSLMFFCGCCFGLLTCCKTVFARRRLIPNRGTFYGATGEEPAAGDV